MDQWEKEQRTFYDGRKYRREGGDGGEMDRWQGSTAALNNMCNKERNTLGRGEDMVHLVSALTRRTLCVCVHTCVCLRYKYADVCILHKEMPMGVYRNE